MHMWDCAVVQSRRGHGGQYLRWASVDASDGEAATSGGHWRMGSGNGADAFGGEADFGGGGKP